MDSIDSFNIYVRVLRSPISGYQVGSLYRAKVLYENPKIYLVLSDDHSVAWEFYDKADDKNSNYVCEFDRKVGEYTTYTPEFIQTPEVKIKYDGDLSKVTTAIDINFEEYTEVQIKHAALLAQVYEQLGRPKKIRLEY